MSAGDLVVMQTHVEEGGIMSPPGTLGSVVNVVTCAGQLQMVILLANGSTAIFNDTDHGGLFPFAHANSESAGYEEFDWITAMLSRDIKLGQSLRFGAVCFKNKKLLLRKDSIVILRERIEIEDRTILVLGCDGQEIRLEEKTAEGVFPLSYLNGSRKRSQSPMHTMEDWREAVAQRATALPYETWASERRIGDIHVKEKWLTAETIRGLRNGQALIIRVHGATTVHDEATGTSYEHTHAPGDTVFVDWVVRGDGLVLECHAEGGGEIVLESRNGFMPVSLPKVENPSTTEAGAVPTLLTGDQVEGPEDGPLTVVGIATRQPLADLGLVVFTAEDGLARVASYSTNPGEPGIWVVFPDNMMTPKMVDMLGRPDIGTTITFDNVDCTIRVKAIAKVQPLASSGIIVIIDQYGEKHLCQKDDDGWFAVRLDELTRPRTLHWTERDRSLVRYTRFRSAAGERDRQPTRSRRCRDGNRMGMDRARRK